ncbi:MAG: hypothetical protein JSS81_25330 [Acidobacteria bacterium]|nr:hypothetical protein [Acidobacteriota bacterium]
MSNLKTALIFLLFVFALPAGAQTAPHAIPDYVTIKNFDDRIAADIPHRWIELVRLVLPSYDPATGTADRAAPIRVLSPDIMNPQFQTPQKLDSLKIVWFMSKGKERLAVIFELTPPDGRGMKYFPLAVFAFAPAPVLLDLVPAGLTDSPAEAVQFDTIFSEIDFGRGKKLNETISLRNTRAIAGVGTGETTRYLVLDADRLRIVYRSPELISTAGCPVAVKKEFYSPYIYARPNDGAVYKVGFLTIREPNENCGDDKYFFPVRTEEIYRLVWSPSEKKFRPRLVEINSMPLANLWGTRPEEELEFKGVLETGVSYVAPAYYDPRSFVRLARPLKTEPGETIRIDWEDPWQILSDKNFRKDAVYPVMFWPSLRETKILANGRRRTVYTCTIERFGNHERFNH